MKKNTFGLAALLITGFFAISANATSIGLGSLTSNPFDTVAQPAVIQDATLLKIFQGAVTLDVSVAAADTGPAYHQSPSLITQAMTMPMSAPSSNPVANAVPAASAPDNNVIIVSEPSLLMLMGFGLLLMGLSRRKS